MHRHSPQHVMVLLPISHMSPVIHTYSYCKLWAMHLPIKSAHMHEVHLCSLIVINNFIYSHQICLPIPLHIIHTACFHAFCARASCVYISGLCLLCTYSCTHLSYYRRKYVSLGADRGRVSFSSSWCEPKFSWHGIHPRGVSHTSSCHKPFILCAT